MFLSAPRCGYRGTEQFADGDYLLVFYQALDGERRGVVRHVRLRQCGNFMSDVVQLGHALVHVGGNFGQDGSARECPEDLWERLHPLPEGLRDRGEDGVVLREWAKANLRALRRLRPPAVKPPKFVYPPGYKPIKRPVVVDGGRGYVHNGSLVVVDEGLGRVICWAPLGGHPRLAVLVARDDLHHSYERHLLPEDIQHVVSAEDAHRHWFLHGRVFGPELLAAAAYGALTGSAIEEWLDHHGEVVFPASRWRQTDAGSWGRVDRDLACAVHYDPYTDGATACVYNRGGRELGRTLRPWPHGTVYHTTFRTTKKAAMTWCEAVCTAVHAAFDATRLAPEETYLARLVTALEELTCP